MKKQNMKIKTTHIQRVKKFTLIAGSSLFCFFMILLFPSCSTTRNLPKGEILYTGIRKIEIQHEDSTKAGQTALEEIEAALSYPPNNALFGSSSLRTPFPFGLWIYNAFVNKKDKIGKWIFNKLAAKPVLISTVSPDVRTKVAQNLLREYGYFDGTAAYTTIPDKKDSLKAKVSYQIDMANSYRIDTVFYPSFSPKADSIIQAAIPDRAIRENDNFSVVKLEAERLRLSTLMRNKGYYYFRPDFITFQADTLNYPGKVGLKVISKPGLPASALRPWYVGDVSFHLNGYGGEAPTDSLLYRGLMIYYEGKLRVRPRVLYNRLFFKTGNLYAQSVQEKTQAALNRLAIFRYTEMQYTPKDSVSSGDTLNLRINAFYDLPLDGEMELNLTSKSNNQAGPGVVLSVNKRNIFGGGEILGVSLRGSYEWQTGNRVNGASNAINSYELGIASTLTFPRVVFPGYHNRAFDYPASTTFKLYADQLNRSRFFKLLSFGGSASYIFQPTAISRHTIVPFRLTYNLLHTTQEFDSVAKENRALYFSLKNQFIPAMSYTYTYDNAMIITGRNHLWWETSITSAGNILSGVYALAGKKFNEEKKFLGNPFAQFLKLTSELRITHEIDRNQKLAMRVMGGIIYSYGNATIAPYNEQFYIGGANSIRAFTVRSIGPGRFRPDAENKYAYIDQTGDLKFEANLEYRFRIIQNLHGALFLDAGSIWLLRNDEARPGGLITTKNFLNDIALGTGTGIRYDLDYLILRLDVGVAIHTPYETEKKGYYNIPVFKDGIGLHLAIGYPF